MELPIEEGRRVAELRSRGVGRWFVAAFLLFWLAGWAAGEAFAISILLSALAPWIRLAFHGLPRIPSGPGGLVVVGFVLLWLSIWTLGGIGAIAAVLSALWGHDRIESD